MAMFNFKRPRSLVVGGASFHGSHLVDALIARGESVIVFDDLSRGRVENLAKAISSGFCTFVYFDITRPAASIQSVVSKIRGLPLSKIFQIAYPANFKESIPEHAVRLSSELGGTMNLVDLAIAEGSTFVYALAVDSLMGLTTHVSSKRELDNCSREEFCRTEDSLEAAVMAAIKSKRVDWRFARLLNCFGPRMEIHDGGTVRAFKSTAPRRTSLVEPMKSPKQSMTYIEDAIASLLFVSCHLHLACVPITIGQAETDADEMIVA